MFVAKFFLPISLLKVTCSLWSMFLQRHGLQPSEEENYRFI